MSDPILNLDAYNIVSQHEIICHTIGEFSHRPNWGWSAKLLDEHNTLKIYASVHRILRTLQERDIPIREANLRYAMSKVVKPEELVKEESKVLTWIEAALQVLEDISKNTLKNLTYDRILVGDDFIMAVCKSTSQAKKLIKCKALQEGITADRHGDHVLLLQEDLPC